MCDEWSILWLIRPPFFKIRNISLYAFSGKSICSKTLCEYINSIYLKLDHLENLKSNYESKVKENKELTKMIALLIHAARIDENYTEKEKKIIINFAEMSSKKKIK